MTSTRDRAADLGLRAMSRAHRAVLHATRGRVLSSAFGMPAVELHTIGRRSGVPRSTMLTTPIRGDGRFVLVASKGGDHRDPDWYLNLVANPEAELTVEGARIPVRARTASPGEKAEMWPEIVAAYRGYAGYQKRTDRDIPVVICEPR